MKTARMAATAALGTLVLGLGLGLLSGCIEEAAGCRSDLDCRGERLCINRVCADPPRGDDNNDPNNDNGNNSPNNDAPNNDVNNDVNNAPNNDTPNNDPNNDIPDADVPDVGEPDADTPDADTPDAEPDTPTGPDIDVVPAALDFGTVTLGERSTATLNVRNVGGAPLTVSRLTVMGPLDSNISLEASGPLPLVIAPGQRAAVVVRWSPSRALPLQAAAQIASDDPDEPLVDVPLTGQVASPGPGCLELRPDFVDLGEVDINQRVEETIQARNCGQIPLRVERARTAGLNSFLRVGLGDLANSLLMPGAEAPVSLVYLSPEPAELNAEVTLVATDGTEGNATVTGRAVGQPPSCPLDNVQPLPFEGIIRFNLCSEQDDFANLADGDACQADGERFAGRDRIFRFVMDTPGRVRVDLRDDDRDASIDTVFYIREACDVRDSQILCADDVPCAESNIDSQECRNNPNATQVRQSVAEVDLEAGEYFVIVDQYTYQGFTCGAVSLSLRRVN